MTTKKDIRVDEIAPPARPRKVAASIALALAVVLALNFGAKAALERYTTNRTYWLIGAKWRLLEGLKAPVDWLVLGDSAGNQGVRIDLLTAKLGGSGVNLCTVGDMLLVHDAWVLARHIEKVGPPKAVVLVHVHDIWPRGLSDQRKELLARVPMPWGFWEKATPGFTVKRERLASMFLTRYVPLYTDNITLSDWAMHPSKPFQSTFSLDAWGYMRNEVTSPAGAAKEGRDQAAATQRGRFQMSEANAQGVAEIARLAEKYGFPVILAQSPVVETAGTRPEFIARLKQIEDGVRAASKNSARFSFVLNPPVTFPAQVMENADHVTHDAAGTYTERLADAILARPAAM